MSPPISKFLFGMLWIVMLAGCLTQQAPQRDAWVTGLKVEYAARYENLHAHVWPAVNKMIKKCHIQNFSIHECDIHSQLYLFAYLEYTGTNFDLDMKRMAEDPETKRWRKETDPCQWPCPTPRQRQKSGPTQMRFIS